MTEYLFEHLMSPPILTVEMLESMDPYSVIASGVVDNSPEGIFVTRYHPEEKVMWVAKRGYIHDWTIYYHWEKYEQRYVLEHGDKLFNRETIRRLVPCTDEAFLLYRF